MNLYFTNLKSKNQLINNRFEEISTMNNTILNLHLEACLEDSIEKLQVTGQIMPLTYEMKKNAKIVNFSF
jgi:hypothetical protein